MTTNPLPTITFETTDCGRCGGTGFFGPLSVDGGRCFGCAGGRIVLTRSGAIARKRYDAIMATMNTPIADVKPGDRVKVELAHTRSWSMRKRAAWYTVIDITSKFDGSKLNGVDIMSHTLTLDLGKINADDWCVPFYSGPFVLPVWDREIYLQAIDSCRRLKGATITDPTLAVDDVDSTKVIIAKRVKDITSASSIRGSHAKCDHAATPADRRRCRAARNV